jgi:hypothetical protein
VDGFKASESPPVGSGSSARFHGESTADLGAIGRDATLYVILQYGSDDFPASIGRVLLLSFR